jgi:hypothetical protein
MFETKVVEKIKTHILCSVPFFSENRAVYEKIMEKCCIAGQATDDNTILRMLIAGWIPKATNTRSEYVILIAFPLQQWLHKRASLLLLYEHCLSCYLIIMCVF